MSGSRLATVVHVNPADTDVVERYLALGAERVVLVAGDPDTVSPLCAAMRGRSDVEVVEAVVAPTAGHARWMRFNVRGLGGLLEPTGLRGYFPRLQLLECVPVCTSTLQTVLDRLHVSRHDDERANLLVLETPGTEAALLQGVARETLYAFGLVLLRGARGGLYQNGVDHEAALRWLRGRAYRQHIQIEETDPLWPVTLMRLHAEAAERMVHADHVLELRAQLEHVQKAFEQRTQQHEAQVQALEAALEQAKARADKLAKDQHDEAEQLRRASEARIEALAKDKAQLTSERDAQSRLAAERQTQANERQKHIQQLEFELADFQLRLELLHQELIKAEGQLELVKDLLFHEEAL
jgi:hypothetical protein